MNLKLVISSLLHLTEDGNWLVMAEKRTVLIDVVKQKWLLVLEASEDYHINVLSGRHIISSQF